MGGHVGDARRADGAAVNQDAALAESGDALWRANLSILTPTRNRPAFAPWLAWVYRELRWPFGDKQLVVVDNDPSGPTAEALRQIVDPRELNLVSVEGRRTVGELRNVALDSADGDFITWLDDDDWRRPDTLETMWYSTGASLNPEIVVVRAGTHIPMLNLRSMLWRQRMRQAWWGGGIYRLSWLRERGIRFPSSDLCEDSVWSARILGLLPQIPMPNRRLADVHESVLCLWHGANIGGYNKGERPLEELTWVPGDVWDMIGALRGRLGLV